MSICFIITKNSIHSDLDLPLGSPVLQVISITTNVSALAFLGFNLGMAREMQVCYRMSKGMFLHFSLSLRNDMIFFKCSGSYLTPQDGSGGTKSVVRILQKDQPVVQQISQYENASPIDLLDFVESVESSLLDHRAIEVIARVLHHTAGRET